MKLTIKDLLSQREQVESRMKQTEADLYYLQGQLALLNQLIEQEGKDDDKGEDVGGISGYGSPDLTPAP